MILDEADRLLDMGFKHDIDKIAMHLQAKSDIALATPTRQTLLFSATFAPEVKTVANTFLRPKYKIIDTVGDDVEQTHSHVPQHIMTVPLHQQQDMLYHLLKQHMNKNKDSYKVMVFFPTAMQTAYMAKLFSLLDMNVLEMHSRKTQGYRTKTSDQFRESKKAIMFTSDVTARGMDYPDVSLVLQMGFTARDPYIHRLGISFRAFQLIDIFIIVYVLN